jgi:hypothetical protein
MRTGIRRGMRTTLAGSLLFGGFATLSLAAISALTAGTGSAAGPVFSSTTPGTYTVIVPAGVTYVTITAVGGSGGSDVGDNTAGGEGGIKTQSAKVTPGESLTVTVGANGHCSDGAGCDALGGSGYGSGGNGNGFGAGGGGGSAVVVSGAALVVAGGGGGSGGTSPGGNADQGGSGNGGFPGTLSGPGSGACVSLPFPFCASPGVGMNGGGGSGQGAGGGGFFGGGAGTSGGSCPTCLTGGGGGGGASYPAPATQWDTTATPSVTISSNPNPTTAVLVPSNGATLSGSTYLDASASNATSVEFLLFGGSYGYNAPVLCTAKPTYYGWLCSWNTTTVPNGSYALLSEAFGAGGSTFSSGVSITVNNPTAVSFASSFVTFYPSQSVGVTLSQSSTNTVQVDFTSADGPRAQLFWGGWTGAASSFSPSSGTVTFAPGQTTATIPLAVNPTTVTGCNSTTPCYPSVTITLSNPKNAILGSTTSTNVFYAP